MACIMTLLVDNVNNVIKIAKLVKILMIIANHAIIKWFYKIIFVNVKVMNI